MHRRGLNPRQVQRRKMQRRAILSIRPRRPRTLIIEKLHVGLQKLPRFVQPLNLEPLHSFAKNVHLPVGEALHHSHDLRRAADDRHLISVRPHHPKRLGFPQAFAHHLPISIFEDVQRQRRARKEHRLQGEQGNSHDCAIMTASCLSVLHIRDSLHILFCSTSPAVTSTYSRAPCCRPAVS